MSDEKKPFKHLTRPWVKPRLVGGENDTKESGSKATQKDSKEKN